MSFDLTALDIMVGFDGYEFAANNFNAPGTYETAMQKRESTYVVRPEMSVPFNLCTAKHRRQALIFLYDNLPFEIFSVIFKMIIDSSILTLHPITGELVEKGQLKTQRLIFFKMFQQVDGATDDQYLLWHKNPSTEISGYFCLKCGEPKLVHVFTAGPMVCRNPNRITNCHHSQGNYRCHRAISIMGGFCFYCIQHINMPNTHTHFRIL
jgi:hypothetical protein